MELREGDVLFQTKSGVKLEVRNGSLYTTNCQEIEQALEEDLHSSNPMDMLMAESICMLMQKHDLVAATKPQPLKTNNIMEIKIKTCGRFVLGDYIKSSDAKSEREFSEEQIMNALNKSKSFEVRDWFGGVTTITFTITNIEKDKYGYYIYTIKSNKNTSENYFPSILDICRDCENTASPISYSILDIE